jgi:hypothetical protein
MPQVLTQPLQPIQHQLGKLLYLRLKLSVGTRRLQPLSANQQSARLRKRAGSPKINPYLNVRLSIVVMPENAANGSSAYVKSLLLY